MMIIINIIIIIVIITSLGLSWDATLKMTGIKLELITDVVMFQFIEKGMRGGISYISLKYSLGTLFQCLLLLNGPLSHTKV